MPRGVAVPSTIFDSLARSAVAMRRLAFLPALPFGHTSEPDALRSHMNKLDSVLPWRDQLLESHMPCTGVCESTRFSFDWSFAQAHTRNSILDLARSTSSLKNVSGSISIP